MLLLLITALSAVSSQAIAINCDFRLNFFYEYVCQFVGIEVSDPSFVVVIAGEHMEGRTDADVEVVVIKDSNTPFIIPQIFTSFPNVIELEIIRSKLESINIPETVQLEFLTIVGNNIPKLRNNSFSGQHNLLFLELAANNIEEIEDNAFVGLPALVGIDMIGNLITAIGKVLHPLVNLGYVDFEQNLLTRIEDESFSTNQNLRTIYFEYNQINEISPRFASSLRETLGYVNLIGNR